MVKYIVKSAGRLGKGAFASKSIGRGTDIAVALIRKSNTKNPDKDFKRTRLGRYINHSSKPNTTLVKRKNRYVLVAKRAIEKDEQLFADYEKLSFADLSFKKRR